MSKQTPLQEFIADILSGKVIDTLANQQYYLDKEKQMVIEAFWNGDNSDCTSEQNAYEFAEQYYNKTYNNDTPNI